jgi:hypothetical protein
MVFLPAFFVPGAPCPQSGFAGTDCQRGISIATGLRYRFGAGPKRAKADKSGEMRRQPPGLLGTGAAFIRAYFNQDWIIIDKTEDPDEIIAIFKQE